MYTPTEKEFLHLAKKGNLIPVYKEIIADLETPVSAYYRICHSAKYSFLLESVEGEEKIAQYSFLARDPELILETKNNDVTITHFKQGKSTQVKETITDTPLTCIRAILDKYKYVHVDGLPRFCGGLVGYGSYDMVRFFEKLPNKTKDDLNLPDTLMALVRELVIFDHRNHKIKVVACVHVDQKATKEVKVRAYKKALKRIDILIKDLNKPLLITGARKTINKRKKLKVKSNLTQAAYKKMVTDAKKQIRAGEIIQAVLSQRFEIDLKTDPFNVYRTLRVLNPSPY
ncbi:MAG: anthranilate synthase component 1, partial [Candidatus Omnitrophota bacterium]